MTPPKPLYGSTIVSISVLLVACGDVPTGPPKAVPPAVQLEAETAANLTFAVDDALDRLMSGSYGHCSNCGRAIDDTRLDFDPALSLCLDCWSREPATAAPSEHNVDAEAVRDISAALQ